MADLESRIERVAGGFQEAESDGQKVKQQPLADLITADKYLKGSTSAAKRHGGLRISKFIPPGARGGEASTC